MELTEARRVAIELASAKEVEWVGLDDGLGRVLADTFFARNNLPGEHRSRFDGFALRSVDSSGASPQDPAVLAILPGIQAAGHVPDRRVGPGECLRIFTGAPVPEGADGVVPQEAAFEQGDRLILEEPLLPGNGVAVPGGDIREGEMVLSKGELLTPTRLALLAGLGCARVPVHGRPKVALLATGDEVREITDPLDGPWTYCNNRLLLAWLVRIHGGVPLQLGVAKDDPEAIVELLSGVESDLVITTGGMGRGRKDFILDAWKQLGVRTCFGHINLSPGKTSALGSKEKQVFWGFPGNPWAAQIVFEELVAPMLWCYQGSVSLEVPSIMAILGQSMKKKEGLCKAVRGVLDMRTSPSSFIPLEGKTNSMFASLRNNFAYTLLESHVVEVAKGTEVQVRLHDFPLLASCFLGKTAASERVVQPKGDQDDSPVYR